MNVTAAVPACVKSRFSDALAGRSVSVPVSAGVPARSNASEPPAAAASVTVDPASRAWETSSATIVVAVAVRVIFGVVLVWRSR